MYPCLAPRGQRRAVDGLGPGPGNGSPRRERAHGPRGRVKAWTSLAERTYDAILEYGPLEDVEKTRCGARKKRTCTALLEKRTACVPQTRTKKSTQWPIWSSRMIPHSGLTTSSPSECALRWSSVQFREWAHITFCCPRGPLARPHCFDGKDACVTS